MRREPALSSDGLDWDRELCKEGCEEWIPWWYKNKKGETVNGCRLGMIPERRIGQWYCRCRKPTKFERKP